LRPAAAPIFLVHDLAGAEAALRAAAEAKRAIVLRNAPRSLGYLGIGYLLALFEAARERVPAADHLAVIDCDDDAAAAHVALKSGAARIAFSGSKTAGARLADIAAQCGALLDSPQPPANACDLLDSGRAGPLARAHLAASSRARRMKLSTKRRV
jgi:hypothetical protein